MAHDTLLAPGVNVAACDMIMRRKNTFIHVSRHQGPRPDTEIAGSGIAVVRVYCLLGARHPTRARAMTLDHPLITSRLCSAKPALMPQTEGQP